MQRDQARDTLTSAQRSRGSETPVTVQELDVLFTGFIRSRSLFDDARRLLHRNQFHPIREGHYQLLWSVLCALRDVYTTWTSDMVLTEIYRELQATPGNIPPPNQIQLTRQDSGGIVWSAFRTPVDNIHIPYCRTLLQNFLAERTVAAPLRMFMESAGPGVYPTDLPAFLQQIHDQQNRIRGMQELPLVEAAPALDTVFAPSSIFNLTGVSYIDEVILGQRQGDANGFIGVTGSGKSTWGTHVAVQSAKMSYDQATQAGTKPELTVVFTYEESAQKMYPRLWSAAFRIRRSKLDGMTHPATQLTTRDNMEEYELRLSEKTGQALSEQERWTVGRVWLNETLKLFDMSGSGDFPHAGSGHIPEMASCLDVLVSQGHSIRTVVVDYAGLVCKRHMQLNDMDDAVLRTELAKFGDRMRREVSERFKCTSWILHQIAAQEGTRHPLKLLHHSQASESKAFAENLAVCGCLGVPDPQTGLRRLNWSKVRYMPNAQIRPVTLRINDEFAIMEDMSELYTIDEAAQRFVSRDTERRFQGGESPASANPRAPRSTTTRSATNIADVLGLR